MVETPTTTKTLDTASFVAKQLVENDVRGSLVLISGGVALLISILVITGVFFFICYQKRKLRKVAEDKFEEPQEDPKTPRTPGLRKRF